MHIWACLWDTKIRDSYKHVKICIYDRADETPKYGILIITRKYAYMIVLMSIAKKYSWFDYTKAYQISLYFLATMVCG